jgi:hypothetical protein
MSPFLKLFALKAQPYLKKPWDTLPCLNTETVAGSLNKRLMLSSSFRCDQIYKFEIYNFGHTLLCYLSPT